MSIIIIIICIAVYWKTLEYNYCIDDWQHNQELLKNPQYLPKTLISKILSSLFESKFIDPKIDHAVSIFIHTLNSVLIYYSFGILPALLFAVHAAATQGSVWVAGRGYAKATMFILLMFTFKWLAPVFYWFAAPGFNAMFSPVVFLYSGFWFWILLIPLIAVLQGKNLRSQIKSKIAITPSLTRKVSFVRLPLYFKTLGYYFVMGIFPWRLGVYHTYLYTYGLSQEETDHWHKPDRYFWVGVLVLYVLIFNLTRPMNITTFGLAWFVALISQWCNFPVTIQQSIAERYLYLPLVGLMVFLSSVILELPEPFNWIAGSAFLTYYLVRLLLHLPSYRSIYIQTEYNAVDFPDNHMSWTWKGLLDKERGSHFTALECWFRGWRIRKNDFRLNNNIAVLLTDMGNTKDAEQFIRIAAENIPPDQVASANSYIKSALNNINAVKAMKEPRPDPTYRGMGKRRKK